MQRPRRWIWVVGLLALTAATCSNDDDPAPRTSSTTAPTSTTLSPEDEVRAAYEAFWAMLERLANAPDPNDPELAQRATGEELGLLVNSLTTQQAQGRVARTGPLYKHSVTSVDIGQDRATMRDCQVDDSTIFDLATGEPVEGGSAVTVLLEAVLVRESEIWRVDHIDTVDTWAGVTSCDQ